MPYILTVLQDQNNFYVCSRKAQSFSIRMHSLDFQDHFYTAVLEHFSTNFLNRVKLFHKLA
jgi:hypothetical protein